ncbi:hypothetical protein L218DRAFT_923430 [Marasmius fiardii PR-910]|nr:hypothetical protein L218DRAFT_923430 [Marasmius fiardii PR-910]
MPKFFCSESPPFQWVSIRYDPPRFTDVADPDYPYPYCINFSAAIAFSVIFGLTTILHFAQAIYFRKKFCWVIVMAGLWETTSYIFRVLSAYDISPQGFGIPSQLLVQLAPLWINAFVYMVFGRVVYYFLPDKRVGHLGARVLSVMFVLLDVLSFLVQGTGAILAGTDAPKLKLIGFHVYQGGVGVQQFFIVIFIVLAIRCQVKLKALEDAGERHRETSWRKVLFPIYGALLLITIRIIYRLTEFAGSFDSGISKSEPVFYVLEATPMSICMCLFNIWHPGAVLVGEESEFKKKDKKKEKKGKGKKSQSEFTEGAALDDQEIALAEVRSDSHDQDIERSSPTLFKHERSPSNLELVVTHDRGESYSDYLTAIDSHSQTPPSYTYGQYGHDYYNSPGKAGWDSKNKGSYHY